MDPESAWRVHLDGDGELIWVNSDERVDRHPGRGFGQRFMDWYSHFFPKELY